MRQVLDFCANWFFCREDAGAAGALAGEAVTLPHTWNAQDGQDGGNDYYRGTCWYAKKFSRSEVPAGERIYIEFEGVAMTAGRLPERSEAGPSRGRLLHVPSGHHRGSGG